MVGPEQLAAGVRLVVGSHVASRWAGEQVKDMWADTLYGSELDIYYLKVRESVGGEGEEKGER